MANSVAIRYVHIQHPLSPLHYQDKSAPTGYTIAYYRTHDYVLFAWTKKHRDDAYVKDTGRYYSQQKLEELHEDEHDQDLCQIALKNDGIYVDHDDCVGVFYTESFTEDLTSLLSDQICAKLSMYDFKHSAISLKLVEAIQSGEYAKYYELTE